VYSAYSIVHDSLVRRNVGEEDGSGRYDESEDVVPLEGELDDHTDHEQDEPVEENAGPAFSARKSNPDNAGQCSPSSQPSHTTPLSKPASITALEPQRIPDVSAPDDDQHPASEFNLDGPATRIGQKRRARNLQAILEVCTCGQCVTQEEIANSQNTIKCTSIGCETQWVNWLP